MCSIASRIADGTNATHVAGTMSFVHLHCHSSFSFHAGVPSVPDIVGRTKELGMPAVGLTDTNRVSGLILHYQECRQQGVRPILGVELTEPTTGERARAVETEGTSRSPGAEAINAAPGRDRENVVLLARSAQGYGDLCEITTQRHLQTDTFTFDGVVNREWPELYFLTSHPRLLSLLAASPNRSRAYGELINNSRATRRRSRELAGLASSLGLPTVAGNDPFFLDADDFDTHRILTAIGLNSTLSRLKPGEGASPHAWFRSAEQMERAFPGHGEALANAGRIAEDCAVDLGLGSWILPQIPVPAAYTPDTYLSELAWKGLEDNYGHKPREERDKARRIQQMELEVIAKLGYSSYFLIVKEIRDWANSRFSGGYRKPKDCTILRGSAANSIT
ncbi:PHP domain-containing protein, partial [Candidatus Latescibacterota bacterium]